MRLYFFDGFKLSYRPAILHFSRLRRQNHTTTVSDVNRAPSSPDHPLSRKVERLHKVAVWQALVP